MFNLSSKLIREAHSRYRASGLWLPVIYALYLLLVGGAITYGINAGQVLPGYSPAEVEILQTTASWPNPLDNFLYWPYYSLVFLLRLVVADGVLAARFVSTLFALAAVSAFLVLLRRRFSVFVSLAGVSLLACNSWFLQLARSGTPEISSLASILVFLALMAAIPKASHNWLYKLGALAAACLAWFTPLLPWLIVAITLHLFYRQRLMRRYLSPKLKLALIGFLGTLVILTAFALIRDQGVIPDLTGIPNRLPAIEAVGDNFSQILQSFFWRAPDNPQQWLANFPLLDVFAAALLPFGIYAFWQDRRQAGFKYCFFGLLGLLIIAGFNRGLMTPGLILIFPLIIAVAGGGLHELLEHWKGLFPQNPLARLVGLNVLLALVTISVFYQVDRYFVAWANNPETRQIYSLEAQSG